LAVPFAGAAIFLPVSRRLIRRAAARTVRSDAETGER
jgi:hypothetical protein